MNELEMNARLQILLEQRDNANNQVVLIGGQLAVLKAELEKVQKELAEMKAPTPQENKAEPGVDSQ